MSKTILANVDGFTPVIDSMVKELGFMTTLVFGKVWRYCQMEDGACKASQDRLAKEIGVSRATINRHIQDLEKAGYLKDTTPELEGQPHTYTDTGKAGLSIKVTGTPPPVTENDATSNTELQQPVTESYTKKESLRDSLRDSAEKSKIPEGFPPPKKKDLVDGFLELNLKHSEKIKIKDDMINKVEKFLGVTPNMAKPSWETVIDGLIKRASQGQTLEQYARWCAANPYDSPKTHQIAKDPHLILDTWVSAFKKEEHINPAQEYLDMDESKFVPPPERKTK